MAAIAGVAAFIYTIWKDWPEIRRRYQIYRDGNADTRVRSRRRSIFNNSNISPTQLSTKVLGRRVVASFIDYLIVTVPATLAYTIGLFLTDATLGLDTLAGTLVFVSFAFVHFLGMPLYFGGFWSFDGQTLGMKLTKIRVIRSGGENMDFQRALVRYLMFFVSYALWLPLLWAIVDSKHQAMHDKITDTLVIRDYEKFFE
ncbi:MAG: RDD family protein [Anaerolineales bacterium]|nr:RDD family protein [Anaerolineales bacterium]